MANELQPTLLEKYVDLGTSEFNKFEKRSPWAGAIPVFQAGRSAGICNVEAIEAEKRSLRRVVEIAVTKKYAANVKGARAINPTPDKMSSARVSTNFFTLAFSIVLTDAIHADNDIGRARYVTDSLHHELNGVFHNSAAGGGNVASLEKQMLSWLATQAYTTPPAVNVPGVQVASGAYQVKADDFVIKASPVMMSLQTYGPWDTITNIGAMARNRELATYGVGNQRNLAQYVGEYDYQFSHNLAVTSGALETHYLMPKGSVCVLNIIEDDAKNRRTASDGVYYDYLDPMYGFKWGVFETRYRENMSSEVTGLERAVTTRFDFAADFAFVRSYSSEAGVSPIVKFNTYETLPEL